MNKIIEVNGLIKSYGNVKAVQDISFYVEKGTLFAFLGPNGAGKSTTIDIITTYLQPDSGSVLVNGFELGKQDNQIRSSIGTVYQDNLLDRLLTVEENLKMRTGLYPFTNQDRNASILLAAQNAGVLEFMDRPYGKLSGGQRRRSDIARALINTPEILFLDEPTTGLDPQTRKNLWEIIRKLQQENEMTIFLTTHYMEEASDADYVVVIDEGKIAAQGTPFDLKERYAGDLLKMSFKDQAAGLEFLSSRQIQYKPVADQAVVKIASTMDALPIIESCRDLLEGFEVINGTMDDAFIGITGKEIRE